MQEAENDGRTPRPDLWMIYAYKDLMQKINREPKWRSLLNMFNSTEMFLEISQK